MSTGRVFLGRVRRVSRVARRAYRHSDADSLVPRGWIDSDLGVFQAGRPGCLDGQYIYPIFRHTVRSAVLTSVDFSFLVESSRTSLRRTASEDFVKRSDARQIGRFDGKWPISVWKTHGLLRIQIRETRRLTNCRYYTSVTGEARSTAASVMTNHLAQTETIPKASTISNAKHVRWFA